MVELDIRLTSDGHVVVLHDPTLRRLWRRSAAVNELDWGSVASIEDGGYRIPDFAEALSGTELPLMVDFGAEEVVAPALEEAKRAGALERCLFVSGNFGALRLLRSLEPRARLGLTWEGRPPAPLGLLRELGAEFFNPYWRRVSERLVASVHDAGFCVSAWTVDRPRPMRLLASWGVDAIVTNELANLLAITGQAKVAGRAPAWCHLPGGPLRSPPRWSR
jgi:glycerophosphoryl diester phosphodiesterase